MKIALIGPGIMPIPPKGWGAVEILIWNLAEALRSLGNLVDIYNDADMEKVCNEINSKEYDLVHLQYDNHTAICRRLLKQPFVVTTHYGFINDPRYWDQGYHGIHNEICHAPGIIALSPEIKHLYELCNYKGFLTHLRNGAEVSKFKWQERGNGKALCLGKIEPRKMQNFLVHRCGSECLIDFVGPKAEPLQETDKCRYLGEWTKEELYDRLTEYSCLILFSAGEAAPLVVPEALAAGLSVVVSPRAAANLPADKKFITIVDTQEKVGLLPAYINGAIGINDNYRKEIREFAESYFDWTVIAKEYCGIIESWKAYCLSSSEPVNTGNLPKTE